MSELTNNSRLDRQGRQLFESHGAGHNFALGELQEITGPQSITRRPSRLPLIAQAGDSASGGQTSGAQAVADTGLANESQMQKEILRQCDPCLGSLASLLVRLSDQSSTQKFWLKPRIAHNVDPTEDFISDITTFSQGDFYAKENRLLEVANLDRLTPHTRTDRGFEFIISSTVPAKIAELKRAYKSVDFAGIQARLPVDSRAKVIVENFRLCTDEFLKEATKLAVIVNEDCEKQTYGRQNRQLIHMQNAYCAARDAAYALWREDTRD